MKIQIFNAFFKALFKKYFPNLGAKIQTGNRRGYVKIDLFRTKNWTFSIFTNLLASEWPLWPILMLVVAITISSMSSKESKESWSILLAGRLERNEFPLILKREKWRREGQETDFWSWKIKRPKLLMLSKVTLVSVLCRIFSWKTFW